MKKAEGRRQKAEAPLLPQAAPLAAQSQIANRKSKIPWWLLAVGLALGTMVLYWPLTRCDFLNYDDDYNLTQNVHVRNGVTWEGIVLYVTDPYEPPGWTPLTMFSHMLVCQVCGLNPWGHHLVNVVLHALNAALVFLFLQQMTGAKWRSLWVAVLFAFHPQRVEAVAWVTQRRELLMTFFGLLALIAYAHYVRCSVVSNQSSAAAAANRGPPATGRGLLYYWICWCLFGLGILSKPTIMTWPFVMLLLDYWPLGRWDVSTLRTLGSSLFRLAREKIAFFTILPCLSIGTFIGLRYAGVSELGARLPLGARVGNALISYCGYLGKLFWPADLAVLYPHPGQSPLGQVALAGGLLLGISALVLVLLRRHPYLLIGWLWYCGTLVPVSQLVTVGVQAMADRWTYVPSLGLLILLIWGADALVRGKAYGRMQNAEGRMQNDNPAGTQPATRNTAQSPIANCKSQILLWVAGGAALVLCWVLTRQQIGFWKDSEVLFRHTVAVTQGNYGAYLNLGTALGKKGQIDEAIRQYQEALRIKPDFTQAHFNLGLYLGQKGQTDEAITHLREGLRLDPDFYSGFGHYILGLALVQKGQIDEAIREYQEAVRVNPDRAEAHYDLGLALGQKGKINEAIRHFQEVVRLKPDHVGARINLGVSLSQKGQTDEAIRQYQEALRLQPDNAAVHYNLGAALARRGQLDEAIRHDQEALRLKPDDAYAHNNLGIAFYRQGQTDEAIRQYQAALRLKPDYAEARRNLDIALAARTSPAPPPAAATNR